MLEGFGYLLFSATHVLPGVTPAAGPLCSSGRRPLCKEDALKGRQPNLLQITPCSQDAALTCPYGFIPFLSSLLSGLGFIGLSIFSSD